MNIEILDKLFNVVDYVLENEYHHFCECLDYDVTGDKSFDDFLSEVIEDDEISHIYKDAVIAKSYLNDVECANEIKTQFDVLRALFVDGSILIDVQDAQFMVIDDYLHIKYKDGTKWLPYDIIPAPEIICGIISKV